MLEQFSRTEMLIGKENLEKIDAKELLEANSLSNCSAVKVCFLCITYYKDKSRPLWTALFYRCLCLLFLDSNSLNGLNSKLSSKVSVTSVSFGTTFAPSTSELICSVFTSSSFIFE